VPIRGAESIEAADRKAGRRFGAFGKKILLDANVE
jgi:hypothetical protein